MELRESTAPVVAVREEKKPARPARPRVRKNWDVRNSIEKAERAFGETLKKLAEK